MQQRRRWSLWSMAVVVGADSAWAEVVDVDGDGRTDLYVANDGQDVLYLQR